MLEKRLFSSDSLNSNGKKVTFALEDDVTYIYPWSPTKYLLFGKYTEEELKRRKAYNEEQETIIPILKKPSCDSCRHCDDESLETAQNPVVNNNNTAALSFWSDTPANTLEEIQIDEDSPSHPMLPSMAIFSPSQDKDLISNCPTLNSDTTAMPLLMPIQRKKSKKKKMLNTNFSILGKSLSRQKHHHHQDPSDFVESLPRLKTTTNAKSVNKALYGSIKHLDQTSAAPSKSSSTFQNTLTSRFMRIPSIDNNDNQPPDLNYTPPQRKPLIRTQISQRYALNESDFSDIQTLREEDFHSNSDVNNSPKKTRSSLPAIYKNGGKKERKSNATNTIIKQTKKTPALHSPKLMKSCRQQVNSPGAQRNNIFRLQLPRK